MGSPILKRPSILGPPPIPEEPLMTSHLVAPSSLLGGAKRKFADSPAKTGLKQPAAKRMTLADRAAAPKLPASKPVPISRSVSSRALSATVGPGQKRPIAAPKSRVASAGFSRSVGPGAGVRARSVAPAATRPPSRGTEESRPSSREGKEAAAKAPAGKPKRPAWDTKGRLEDMELAYQELKQLLAGTTHEKENMNDLLASERARRNFLLTYMS
jgi:kinesin family member C1